MMLRTLVARSALVAGIVTLGLLVGACGGDDDDASAISTKPTAAATAEDAIARLQASGLPLTNVVVYDEATDENELLGRPNQYIGKANWLDGRDDDDTNTYSVEVFENEDDLNARKEYVEAVTGSMAAFCEYDTVHGLVLLRVSCHLTPTQAQEYADALDS